MVLPPIPEGVEYRLNEVLFERLSDQGNKLDCICTILTIVTSFNVLAINDVSAISSFVGKA